MQQTSAMLPNRTDLSQLERVALAEKLKAELTEARIHFQTILRVDHSTFAPWELSLLEKADSPSPKGIEMALAHLAETFLHPLELSPIEWQTIGRWFGNSAQASFLKTAFAMEKLPLKPAGSAIETHLLWVEDPYSRFLPAKEQALQKKTEQETIKKLEALGYAVEVVELGAYAHLDDQAEELHLNLLARDDDQSFVLVTSGHASAILHRCLDLNPILMHQKEILGWLNVNGLLYGAVTSPSKRKPSSLTNGPAARQEQDAERELWLLHQEGFARQPDLHAGFPVLNVIQPGLSANAREQLEPDGRTLLEASDQKLSDTLAAALPLLKK